MRSDYTMPKAEQSVLETLRQPFAVFQLIGKQFFVMVLSDGFLDLFGYTDRIQAYDEINRDLFRDVHPDDKPLLSEGLLRMASNGGKYEVSFRSRIPETSKRRIVHAFFDAVSGSNGAYIIHAWYADGGIAKDENPFEIIDKSRFLNMNPGKTITDTTVQYDYLTGLLNVNYFYELAAKNIEKIRDEVGNPVFIFLDFLGMKFYNAKHGYSEGDNLLKEFAEILSRIFGPEQSCRVESNHFTVLTDKEHLEQNLDLLFHEYQNLDDVKNLPLHAGIFEESDEPVDLRTSFERAKLACNALRGRYEPAISYYSQELSEAAKNRQYIIENLNRAIADRWIQIYFQPIIRSVSGQVCDIEALARWIDPVKGILTPKDFIPVLEEVGLIYKLDLYVVDRILEMIHEQKKLGLFIIPHSINLSRSDFEACDIVEEIRQRVDDAGVSRDRITIEITESVIGRDYEYMKEQIGRFHELGFPVWMDDFGSGYSSLDVLQSIPFDLIKFDMSFLRRLNEGDSGKVILAELMRMAGSLGLDTVCEGVETEEQIHFLQEIGCSKLQGYYFSKPAPFEAIREMEKSNTLLETERPEESEYYESLSRTNLYDLREFTSGETDAFHNVFDTLPAAVIEVIDGKGRIVRYNSSYQDFVKRFFGDDVRKEEFDLSNFDVRDAAPFFAYINDYISGTRSPFFNQTLPDGSVIHSFLRKIGSNPVNGRVAVSHAVLFITDPGESATYADIAEALAADYYNIYVIDLDTDEFFEYSSNVGGEELEALRRGTDFFESARRETLTRIFKEDQQAFLELFTKENVLRDLDSQGVFTTTYRLTDTGTPMYVNMKITRMRGGNRLILGISNIDSHMKQQEEDNKLRQEKMSLSRIAALSPDYIVLYTVDIKNGHYTQYNPSYGFEKFALSLQGTDFFGDVVKDAPKAIAPEDMERHLCVMDKDNFLRVLRQFGTLTHRYRLLLNGTPVPVALKAVLIQENDEEKIILGVSTEETK